MLTLLFDGIAYGMLLFILAVGLAVTLGLMNFINLAHGAFAMAGGYVTVLLMNRAGVPFLACLPIAFVAHRGCSARCSSARSTGRCTRGRTSTRCCSRSASCSWRSPRSTTSSARCSRTSTCRTGCRGASPIEAVGIGKYRLFIVVVCALLTVALQWVLSRTRFGSRLRASVDDPRVAGGLGLDVNRIFLLTFAVGSGLAGLGGALGAEVLGLDPTFPLKFMIYFLIVVSVGGTTTITGPLLAALLLGIADVAGKYYVPKLGAFIVYTLMIVILLLAAAGPVRAGERHDEHARRRVRRPRAGRGAARRSPGAATGPRISRRRRARCARYARWRWWELALFAALPLRGCCCRARRCCSTRSRSSRCSRSRSTSSSATPASSRSATPRSSASARTRAALFAKHVMPDPLVGLVVAIARSRAARRC